MIRKIVFIVLFLVGGMVFGLTHPDKYETLKENDVIYEVVENNWYLDTVYSWSIDDVTINGDIIEQYKVAKEYGWCSNINGSVIHLVMWTGYRYIEYVIVMK